ncbi:hypothetical protein LUZ61_020773 [Rhynchospora tenuis]|uniref:Uncharacterized protein n=1 Tax=Rhynchospora tenuis TaxID=198213 RepID=A0AAD6EP49_9POAL|nr:hypothetical protein LUZ61_020773 [Rhynchospora tenuis]
MAESIVKFILDKLEDATVQELLHLCGVQKQIKLLGKELGWIQTFLKDADRNNNSTGDEHQRHWLKEIRDVVYDIEDAIVKACLLGIEMEDPKKRHSKWEVAKRKFKSPKKLPAQHELGVEINAILERIKKISESREKYGTNNHDEGSEGQIYLELPVKPLLIHTFDDPDIVGFEHDRDNIIKQLLDDNTNEHRVISIVGPGGLGKTTLGQKIFNRY